MNAGARILSIGTHYPERVVTNKELEKTIDTSDEWITTKIGIKERRFINPGQALSDICIPAANSALKKAGIGAEDIDVIIVGALSHDYVGATLTGNIVKEAIGAKKAYAIDVNIICAGFIYCIDLASALIISGRAKNVMIINGEVFSKFQHSRVTSVIFGDGAAATIMTKTKKDSGVVATYINSCAKGSENLGVFIGGSKKLVTKEAIDAGEYAIKMNGKEIYQFAINAMQESVHEVLKKAGLSINDIDHIFIHQANLNIIKQGLSLLGIPESRTVTNIQKFGNIGGASVATVLAEALEQKKIKKGDLVCLVAFGSGLAWGASLFRWE